MKIIILLAIIGTLLCLSIIFFMAFKRPLQFPLLTPSNQLKVIGWIPNWDQQNAMQSYTDHVEDFNYISVFWYKLDTNGKLGTYEAAQEDPAIMQTAHNHHEKVFALVANLPDYSEHKDWDADRVQKAIGTENARRQHIHDLVNLVTEKKFDGLDIDYEALRASQKNDFSIFMTELATALHAKNKLLGVAIYPPFPQSDDQGVGAAAQDLPTLAAAADQLYFMTYLEHTLSSPPGPTGGLPWIRQSIDYAIYSLHIPKEKIYLGIGLMGIAWRQNPDGSIDPDRDDLTFQEIFALSQNTHIPPSWDKESQSPYLIFSDQNGKHIIWFENNESVTRKIAFAKENNLGGIAFWRLGGEDPDIWQKNIFLYDRS